MSDPIRDCPHGHMKGKCDSCELIIAEQRIADLEGAYDALAKETADVINDRNAKIKLLEAVAEAAEKAIQKSIISRIAVWPELHRLLHDAGYLKGEGE